VTVAIIGTNDIHGAAFPTKLFRSDTNETYNYGGLEYMATMIKTIK
jgi:2',3'-cyclic-nucleotide 2'-phosphodiesterase (5'-nucleotidase family)